MVKIDIKDRKILSCLLDDCRQSHTQIAKKCGLSREVVSYRINQLEKENIIISYTSDINYNNLGYIAYSVGLNIKNIDEIKIKKLKTREKIVYLQSCLGRFNLTCTLLLNNLNELKKEYDFIVSLFGLDLLEINADVFIGDIDFSANIFENTNREFNFLSQNIIIISESEKRILTELVKNSKKTVIELSDNTNLSVPTITSTLKKLKKENIIIANRILLNLEALNLFKYTLLVFANPIIEKKIIQYCKVNHNIWDIGKYCGTYNYVIEIFAENNSLFERIVNEIKEIFKDDIYKTDILVNPNELKHQYLW